MTPLIAMYINRGVGFDPAQYTWMDMSVLPEDFNASEMLAEEGVLNTKMHLDKLHLPFPNIALVVRKDEETVLTITTRDEGILVEEWGSDKEHVGTWTPEKGFVYHPLWAQAAKKYPDKYGTAKDFGEIIASRIAVLEALMLYTFKKKRMVHGSHDVRGHWSVSKLGKRYWVKSHKRGDSAKGTIFHDYVTGVNDD